MSAGVLNLQHIEVPETLLKKRKATDKAREERLAAALAARKVSDYLCSTFYVSFELLETSSPTETSVLYVRYDDSFIHDNVWLALTGDVATINHLSGLSTHLLWTNSSKTKG